MVASKSTLRTCSNGHKYYKSSDCPVCPTCEKNRISKAEFMTGLSAPARRALENAGINRLKKLSKLTETELLQLHGMGPSSIPKLRVALQAVGVDLKKG